MRAELASFTDTSASLDEFIEVQISIEPGRREQLPLTCIQKGY